MEEIVEREKKSFFKILLVLLGLVFLVDLVISLLNSFNTRLPYLTTLIAIGLVTIACGFVILRYMSRISYSLSQDYLVFSRLIGKRAYEIIRIPIAEIYFVGKESEDSKKRRPLFDLSLDGEKYVCKYRREGKEYSIIFSPSKKFLDSLSSMLK